MLYRFTKNLLIYSLASLVQKEKRLRVMSHMRNYSNLTQCTLILEKSCALGKIAKNWQHWVGDIGGWHHKLLGVMALCGFVSLRKILGIRESSEKLAVLGW